MPDELRLNELGCVTHYTHLWSCQYQASTVTCGQLQPKVQPDNLTVLTPRESFLAYLLAAFHGYLVKPNLISVISARLGSQTPILHTNGTLCNVAVPSFEGLNIVPGGTLRGSSLQDSRTPSEKGNM